MLRTSQRQRQTGAASPRPEGSGLGVALPRGGGGELADFSIPAGGFSGGFFWRIFPLHFATKKIHRKIHRSVESSCFRNPRALIEAPEIHRPPPPPPRESKSKSCAFGSGTVTFQGGSFQEKTPGLIGPRNLRILIGRIAVGWPCMECHVPCHISIYWVSDSVKQSEGWGKNPALIARSPTRHSNIFIEKFHHKSSLLVWLPKLTCRVETTMVIAHNNCTALEARWNHCITCIAHKDETICHSTCCIRSYKPLLTLSSMGCLDSTAIFGEESQMRPQRPSIHHLK